MAEGKAKTARFFPILPILVLLAILAGAAGAAALPYPADAAAAFSYAAHAAAALPYAADAAGTPSSASDAAGSGATGPPGELDRLDRLDEAGGEYGVEYQLSLREAAAFFDRMSESARALVEQALSYLGTPYRRGGVSRHGVDCSGLTGVVFERQGVGLPRTAARQFAEGTPVAQSELRPGDLVFFRDTYKRGISHVGIYVGDGNFIHAAGRRAGVIVSGLDQSYYRRRFAGARRLTHSGDPFDRTLTPAVAVAAPSAPSAPAP